MSLHSVYLRCKYIEVKTMAKTKLINIRIDQDLLDQVNDYCDRTETNKSQLIINFLRGLVSGESSSKTAKKPDTKELEAMIDDIITEKLESLNLQQNIENAIVKNQIEPLKDNFENQIVEVKNTVENLDISLHRLQTQTQSTNNILKQNFEIISKKVTNWIEAIENIKKSENLDNKIVSTDIDQNILSQQTKPKLTDKQVKDLNIYLSYNNYNYDSEAKILKALTYDLNSKVFINNKSVYWLSNDKLHLICRSLGIKIQGKANRALMIEKIKEAIGPYL